MTEPPDQEDRSRKQRASSLPARSLRYKLLLFAALVVLVPGALLATIAELSASDSLQQVIGRQLAREANHTADRLSTLLRSERQALASFARQDLMREVRVADIDKRISMALATFRAGSPVRLGYLVVDREGRVVASSEPDLIGGLPAWVDPAWARPDGEELLRGPLPRPGHEGQLVVMTTPVPDPDGAEPDGARRRLGTLIGLFDWGRLTALTEAVRADLAAQGVTVDVLVCLPDGTVIGGARASAGEDPGREAGIAEAARAPGAQAGWTVSSGAGLIVGRASLQPGLPEWRLLVVEPRADALAPARRQSRRMLLAMGLALAVALALAALAAGRVVRPLVELTGAVRGLAREGGPRQVQVRSEDEIGTLAAAFNQMAADLERTQHELVEAEKFALVGELASGIAHEIRTSLGVLRSSAQILQRSLPADADAQTGELAQMVHAEVGRLAGVVDDLLTLDRPHPLRLEAVPVSRAVFRAADFVGPQAREKGVEMVRTPAAREPSLSCEPELIYQVAVNLLVNATQALPDGGRVELRILEASGGHGGFEVRDDGEGIPEPLRERIFEPFVTARSGGVGLGLTFVKRVVHDHRGRIELESEPGSGTCVRILLPVAEAQP
jgi:signal transduction histidine kinase